MLKRLTGKITLCALVAAISCSVPALAAAKEYMLAGTKPDKLFLIDIRARKVERSYTVPNAGDMMMTIVPSPDGKRAYVLTNHMSSVSGIDLDTGKQVFRADFSSGDVNVKDFFALDVSPDGKELYTYQLTTERHPAEYKVLEPRIVVYNTSGGINAKPVRSFPAPRRIQMLMAAKQGGWLYALGFDLYKIDPKTGRIVETVGVMNWKRPGFSKPDVLDFWPLWDQTSIFSTPYYTSRTDVAATDANAAKSGIMTLDLKTGAHKFSDFETTAVLMFSSVISPTRPDEAFAVYTQLTKIDMKANKLAGRVDLPHTYYAVNISRDGNEVYVGGAMCDIGVYDHSSLKRIGEVKLPGCGDMSLATIRMIER